MLCLFRYNQIFALKISGNADNPWLDDEIEEQKEGDKSVGEKRRKRRRRGEGEKQSVGERKSVGERNVRKRKEKLTN